MARVPGSVGSVKFIPSPSGIARLGETAAMKDEMKERAERIKEAAIAIAPRSDSDGEHYADMIEIVEEDDIVRVVAQKFTSGWLEFGTIYMPAVAPLRQGAEAAGLAVGDAPEETD